jgi:protein SDA1
MSSASRGAGAIAVGSVIERLSNLQNLIKRDYSAYSDEFRLQHRNFLAELEIFRLQPSTDAETFKALVTFLSHVSVCYPAELAAFPLQLTELLVEHADALHADVRRVVAQALILMRNRGGIEALPLLKVCFRLFRVKDKLVRCEVLGARP